MNMNQMNRMNQQAQAIWPQIVPLYLPSIRYRYAPHYIYNNNLNFNDIDDIIYKLSLRILTNLSNYRAEQIKKSELFLYLYYYTQIKRTNKKAKIYNFIINKIFNSFESLINDIIFINNHNNLRIYTDLTEEQRRDPINLIHYAWNGLSESIKNIIKYKLLEEFLYYPDYRQFEQNFKHLGEPLGSAYIRFYNRTHYMDFEYKGRINCFIFNYENIINLNNINNEYISGLFYYLINYISYETLREEEEEEEEEEAEGFDFFSLSYNNPPPPEEETEEKQKEKIKEIIRKNYILINKTNLYYIDYNKDINNSFNYYKILQVKENQEDTPACCLCLETDINIYRFQAVAGSCSCPSFWCFDCLIYNNYKNNKNNIMDFKCLICKKNYINFNKELNYNNLLNTGYYEQIKKDLFKVPFKINDILYFENYEKSKSYIKESIKYNSFNMPDFSKLLYNDIIIYNDILNELKKKVFIKNYNKIISFNNNNKNLLTKKNEYNKTKLKKLKKNILINLLENYKNLIRIDYETIRNDKNLFKNYSLLIFEEIRRE